MSKYNKTYMECLEIAAARLGTPELAIDIQFAHEDKHYELMQTAAELYLYLSDLHKHSVSGKRPDLKYILIAYGCKHIGLNQAYEEILAACASGAVDKTVSDGKEEQKQNLIDLMKTDEEHGMYETD